MSLYYDITKGKKRVLSKTEVYGRLYYCGFENGEICGIRTRSRAVVDSLKWNITNCTAEVTITSDIAQTIEISSGLSEEVQTVTFKEGESKTVTFDISL